MLIRSDTIRFRLLFLAGIASFIVGRLLFYVGNYSVSFHFYIHTWGLGVLFMQMIPMAMFFMIDILRRRGTEAVVTNPSKRASNTERGAMQGVPHGEQQVTTLHEPKRDNLTRRTDDPWAMWAIAILIVLTVLGVWLSALSGPGMEKNVRDALTRDTMQNANTQMP